MILYSVTVNIEDDAHDQWLHWMRHHHVPAVLATGLFRTHKILRLLTETGNDGVTYSFQYTLDSMGDYETYQNNFADKLRQEVTDKFKDKFVAFRTLLEVIEESK